MALFSDLEGKTITSVKVEKCGGSNHVRQLIFQISDGRLYRITPYFADSNCTELAVEIEEGWYKRTFKEVTRVASYKCWTTFYYAS
jgi:hypothetical protein